MAHGNVQISGIPSGNAESPTIRATRKYSPKIRNHLWVSDLRDVSIACHTGSSRSAISGIVIA